MPILALMGVNFYLHGRRLAERPANKVLITLASLLDIALITLVVVLWGNPRGLGSEFYIMYYPMVLAFAFVMQPKLTSTYTLIAVMAYVAASLTNPGVFFLNGEVPGAVGVADVNVEAVKVLLFRVITLAAVGGLGTYYYRKQRERRREVAQDSALVPSAAEGS